MTQTWSSPKYREICKSRFSNLELPVSDAGSDAGSAVKRALLSVLLLAPLGAFAVTACRTCRLSGVVELDGSPVDPRVNAGAQASVLIFTRSDCPISNRYAPELNRLAASFAPRNVAFWSIYVDKSQDPALIRQHVADYQLPGRVAIDRKHRLVALVGAQVTPEAALFDARGRLVYHGRIDDRFVDLNIARPEPTQRDLEQALHTLLSGSAPTVAHLPAVGCLIEDLR